MSDKSHIEWTDATWNPTTGCTKVSEGCRHCYIDRTPPFRIKGISFDKGEEIGATTGVQLHQDRLKQPLKWARPRRIFVNSLSDLFHDDIPDEFIARVFGVMDAAHRHVYQVLTKRPRRALRLLSDPDFRARVRTVAPYFSGQADQPYNDEWPLPNVWLGTSVEDQKAAELRIPLLLETPAAVRFLSCEPLLGPVELTAGYHDYLGANPSRQAWKVEPAHASGCNCAEASYYGETPTCPIPEQVATSGIDWVIVGGESGPKARPMHPDWARSLRDQCNAAGVPFFFKQWGEWVTEDQSPQDITLPSSGSVPWAKWDSRTEDLVGDQTTVYKVGKKHAGRELDGRTWDEMPARERVG